MSRDRKGRGPGRPDPWTSPEWKAYAAHAANDLIPKVTSSAVTLALVPDPETELDMKFCIELGACIMLDKPILGIAVPGQRIPERYLRVADEVLYIDLSTPEGQEELQQGLTSFMQRFGPQQNEAGHE